MNIYLVKVLFLKSDDFLLLLKRMLIRILLSVSASDNTLDFSSLPFIRKNLIINNIKKSKLYIKIGPSAN
jgi:hypothetical protein